MGLLKGGKLAFKTAMLIAEDVDKKMAAKRKASEGKR